MKNQNMDYSVVVLMSTYNGHYFIKEQIDSILNQTYEGNILLYIRDDGSCDGTVDYIMSCNCPYNRKIILVEGSNIGPQKSFLFLLKNSPDAKYYFFADQDDIWNLNKIDKAVKELQDKEIPSLFCSNFSLINFQGEVIKEKGLAEIPCFGTLPIIFFNKIPGCTIGFNNELMAFIRILDLESVVMHDIMALSLCSVIGNIIYDNTPYIKHRIHGNNVIGSEPKKIVLKRWIPEKMTLLLRGADYKLTDMTDKFLELVGDNEVSDSIYELHLISEYKTSVLSTIRLLLYKKVRKQPFSRNKLSVICRILFRIY